MTPEDKAARKKAYQREYRKANPHKEYQREYQRRRRATDPSYKLAHKLRATISLAISAGIAAEALLGCSIPEFKSHIEAQFTEGMSWDNYGRGHTCWQFDHTIPLASFNLTNPEEQKTALHFTNVKPMWARDNQAKGSKVPSI